MDPNDSVLHPKLTHNVWGAVLVVYLQYGWITFRSNFDDFSRTRYRWSSPGAVKVARFCTKNILTLYGAHFISFSISTDEKRFDRILTSFPVPGMIGVGKLEKSGSNDSVLHPKHTHTLWGAVLIVSHQYGWKMFRSYFEDFCAPGYHRSRHSWKSGPDDSVLHLKLTHTIWSVVLIIFL